MSEWVKHTGDCLPVPKGTLVVAIDRRGVIDGPFPAGCTVVDPAYSGATHGSAWIWGSNINWPQYEILRYRLHDNGEQAKREARIASLRKMAQPNDYDVRPIKVPEREKVKQ